MKLDGIDRKILSLLVENARMTQVEIGRLVSLSAPAVKRRIERLERSGAIRGYSARIDQGVLGQGTEAFLELYAQPDGSLESLRRTLAELPEVVAAYSVAGDAEALLHVRTADIAHLEETIERIHAQPNVVRTKTQVVLSTLIDRQPPP